MRERSYNVFIEKDLNRLSRQLRILDLGTDAVVVTNSRIVSLFGDELLKSLAQAGLKFKFSIVPDSEKAKSVEEAIRLLRVVSRLDGKGKRLFLIAFGGGVIGDLSGFVASIYRRGIPYVHIPTTLLAQVDSSIGGKTAIDLPTGKNLVGSFYQPKLVYINISFIKRLSERDFISGLSEVIKYSIIKDRLLFKYLEDNRDEILRRKEKYLFEIVRRCAKIKASIVSGDEKEEKAIRTILNFGHTIGHAIETATNYSNIYSHGEAIAIGMIAASCLSSKMGYLLKADLLKIEKLIGSFGLPNKLKGVNVDKIIRALAYDKKFIHGVTRFVLPIRIGKVVIKENVLESMIREELNRLAD